MFDPIDSGTLTRGDPRPSIAEFDDYAADLARMRAEFAAELRIVNRLEEVVDVAEAVDFLLERVPPRGLEAEEPEGDATYWRRFDDWALWQEAHDRVAGFLARLRAAAVSRVDQLAWDFGDDADPEDEDPSPFTVVPGGAES